MISITGSWFLSKVTWCISMLSTLIWQLPGVKILSRGGWVHLWSGLYVVSPLAYELQVSRGLSRLHPVFHITKLKPAHQSSQLVSVADEPGPVLVDGEEEWEVEAIVKHRKCGRRPMEYLVTFVGFPLHSEALWYREDALENAQELWQNTSRPRASLSRYMHSILTSGGWL
jgi:hypothetical protein